MMRTAVLQAPRRFEVTEQPTPRPGRGEAVVRVAGTAVCHTDLAIYTGRHPGVRYPVILGHEAAGVVEAVGPDTSIGVGARVVINPIIACGACDCCVRGDENLCRRAGLLGRELPGPTAEVLVAPHAAVARAARDDRVDHDPRAHPDARVGTDRLHDAGGLVAEDHGVAHA